MHSAEPRDTLLQTAHRRVSCSWVRTLQRRAVFALIGLLVFVAAPGCGLLWPAPGPPKPSAGQAAKPTAAPVALPPAIQDETLPGPPEFEGPPLPPKEEEMVGPPLPPAGGPAAPSENVAGDAQPSAARAGASSSVRNGALLAAFGRKKIAAQPCPRGVLIVLPESLFEYGTAELPKASRRTLHEIAAAILEAANGVPVSVEGHTDSIEAEMFNQGLSERRARAVASEFVAAGIPAKLLHSEGFGSRMPIAPNSHPDGSDDPEGRARNRRVEIVIETENGAGG